MGVIDPARRAQQFGENRYSETPRMLAVRLDCLITFCWLSWDLSRDCLMGEQLANPMFFFGAGRYMGLPRSEAYKLRALVCRSEHSPNPFSKRLALEMAV
jgi:hypothetical protein